MRTAFPHPFYGIPCQFRVPSLLWKLCSLARCRRV